MNTPEPAKKKILIIDDRLTIPPGLKSEAKVARKLTKRQQKFRKRALLTRSQTVVCQKCRKPGGTLHRLPHTNKEGGALYIHNRCT